MTTPANVGLAFFTKLSQLTIMAGNWLAGMIR